MSSYWTFRQADRKLREEMDLVDDESVPQSEMIDKFNDAMREAEAHIHGLGFEDEYFLTSQRLDLTSSVAEYDLPQNIYANKIRELVYSEGIARTYCIRPYKRLGKFQNIAIDNLTPATGYNYLYYLKDDTANAKPVIVIVPTPVKAGNFITIWYIRNANRIVQVDDVLDIPEFISFIFSHVRKAILMKKKELTEADMKEYEDAKELMISTLRNQTDSNNDDIGMDTSIYREHA